MVSRVIDLNSDAVRGLAAALALVVFLAVPSAPVAAGAASGSTSVT